MTTEARPFSHLSSGGDLSCCACESYDRHHRLKESHYSVYALVCTECGHLTCDRHTVNRLCYGCAWKDGEEARATSRGC